MSSNLQLMRKYIQGKNKSKLFDPDEERNNIFNTPPVKVIKETSINQLDFNVMPNKPVQEILFIKEYRIWDRSIEAIFNRKYSSSMAKSPSHLIFLSTLVHLQKMLYVYFCHEFQLPYKPDQDEQLKIWPTGVTVEMPKMVTSTENITHRVIIDNFNQTGRNSYYGTSVSNINDLMFIKGEAAILLY